MSMSPERDDRRACARPHRRGRRASVACCQARSGARSAWTIPAPGSSWSCPQSDSWFAYPYWLDDRLAPDFARTVDIHRKPGYDPCELFFDPDLFWPKGRAIRPARPEEAGVPHAVRRDPARPGLVRGSHGVPAAQAEDRPILIGDGPAPAREGGIPMSEVHGLLLGALGGN